MAVRARGVATWQDIFVQFKAQTGLFVTSTFDIPSQSNPRIAGGMHFNGDEYLAFLRALRNGALLNAASMNQLLADYTATVPIVYSPFLSGIGGGPGLGEDWHFGFGLAHECRSPTFNCGRPRVIPILGPCQRIYGNRRTAGCVRHAQHRNYD